MQSKEEMNLMITTRIEEMWETLDRNQSVNQLFHKNLFSIPAFFYQNDFKIVLTE